jgi:large subunit ribosomal protein L27
MATKKAGGSSRNGRDSAGRRLGMGKDHSIFSVIKGKVVFKKTKSDRTFVSVKPN